MMKNPSGAMLALFPAAVEGSQSCDRSQHRNDMAPEAGSSKPEPRSPKTASSTGQHIETSASSQQSRMTSGENPVYAPAADDTKELKFSFVEAATACVPPNRNGETFVQAAYGVRINDHSRAEGSKQVPGAHVTNWGSQGRSSLRPGTSISTICHRYRPLFPTTTKTMGA
jgi:hypothetical protein